jgi:hypothetical protein
MPEPFTRFSDTTNDNWLSAKKLVGPNGPLTRWRQNHPNGDPVDWQQIPSDDAVLRRFRGGPFLVDQFQAPSHYTLDLVYRGELDGFTGLVYRTDMRYSSGGGPQLRTFMVFSIDTPRSVPRTEIRPAAFGDKFHKGFQGVKTGDKDFDHQFHVQTEDEQFTKALLTPEAMRFFEGEELAKILAVIFEGNTLSTWNHQDVTRTRDQYVRDYMSLLVDYLIRILKSTPAQLWRG